MTCDACGGTTPRSRLCRKCARPQDLEELDVAGDAVDLERARTCATCDEEAPDGAYSPARPGVWLCRDHLKDERADDVDEREVSA